MIDWNDNAKAAVRSFAAHVGYERTVKLWLEGKGEESQTKTVADAWEEFGGEWEEPKDFVCIWNTKTNNFEFWLGGYNPVSHCYVVCDYQQFEAYGREQEAKQEGEKWTHTYNELKCRALITEPDREGYIVIVNELNEYYCVDDEELEPIKPTISKAEAWDRLTSGAFYNAQYGIDTLQHEYNIT